MSADKIKMSFNRLCDDFTVLVSKLEFERTSSKGHSWQRVVGSKVEEIFFFRKGSSYGKPTKSSVTIRVHFSTHQLGEKPPFALNGPSSDFLKDNFGNSYHLRYNADTGSTYERCLSDLYRVTNEHGVPWFKDQSV